MRIALICMPNFDFRAKPQKLRKSVTLAHNNPINHFISQNISIPHFLPIFFYFLPFFNLKFQTNTSLTFSSNLFPQQFIKSLRTLKENFRTYLEPSFACKMRLIVAEIKKLGRQTPKIFAQPLRSSFSRNFKFFCTFF